MRRADPPSVSSFLSGLQTPVRGPNLFPVRSDVRSGQKQFCRNELS